MLQKRKVMAAKKNSRGREARSRRARSGTSRSPHIIGPVWTGDATLGRHQNNAAYAQNQDPTDWRLALNKIKVTVWRGGFHDAGVNCDRGNFDMKLS
jgi:hypothetical protein